MADPDLRAPLSDTELDQLEDFLARVEGGRIPNLEALDGFLTALAVCPELVKPSEFMEVIQTGETEDGDLVFDEMEEAEFFLVLVKMPSVPICPATRHTLPVAGASC